MACDSADTPRRPEAPDEGTTAWYESDNTARHSLSNSEQPLCTDCVSMCTFTGARVRATDQHIER
jgi:hypothetical protein